MIYINGTINYLSQTNLDHGLYRFYGYTRIKSRKIGENLLNPYNPWSIFCLVPNPLQFRILINKEGKVVDEDAPRPSDEKQIRVLLNKLLK